MKLSIAISTLALLLTACTLTMSDASIRRQAPGIWSSESQPGKVIESRSDGTCVISIDGVEKVSGNWWVSHGYLVARLRSPSQERIESNKVIRISAKEVVVLSIDGQTQVTFYRH